MSISEQVKELRELAKGVRNTGMLFPNWRYKTLKQAADTIESLSVKLQAANMERPAEDYIGWIPCSERLPKESLDSVIGWDECRKRCCFVQYLGGRWILGNDTDSVKITVWRPLPEEYHG